MLELESREFWHIQNALHHVHHVNVFLLIYPHNLLHPQKLLHQYLVHIVLLQPPVSTITYNLNVVTVGWKQSHYICRGRSSWNSPSY